MMLSRIMAAIRGWPVKSQSVRKALVADDKCPECGGELDTGWECNDCGYDAMPIANGKPQGTPHAR